jgi:hypothetical protein
MDRNAAQAIDLLGRDTSLWFRAALFSPEIVVAKKPSGGKQDGRFRSAITGQYVTEKYAKSYPSTTVKETKPGGSKPGTKSK